MTFSFKLILFLFMAFTCNSNSEIDKFEPITFDFGSKSEVNNGMNWRVTNDGVMGGLSKGKAIMHQESLSFSGYVSLENNGGFSSFSSPYGRFNLGEVEFIEIRYKSKGQNVAITLDNYRQYWKPNYKHKLETANDWQTVKIPMKDFKEEILGRKTGKAITKEKQEDVIQIGFIVANKENGAFEFEIDYMKFI